ncbi:hypothetical protein BpHYR1_004444 [Brachionus plicatilis]|uniref:Uncharacterized protein n=1 Tax=Brachionus plicatilis TaxID=10195 RepID=A0A3M7RPE8_BRAPC|nr:hypothetical protein BpHYR1_004444 [Brachionus plicatilis]
MKVAGDLGDDNFFVVNHSFLRLALFRLVANHFLLDIIFPSADASLLGLELGAAQQRVERRTGRLAFVDGRKALFDQAHSDVESVQSGYLADEVSHLVY